MDDTRAIHRAYHHELADHPDPARRAGWRSHVDQRMRHAACLAGLQLDRVDGVLDVGCGPGDLVGVLRQLGFCGRYLGIDILPEMVEAAQQRWPAEEFAVHDLAEVPLQGRWGLVVACGTISLALPNHAVRVATFLRALWAHTADALVVLVPHQRGQHEQPGGSDSGFHFYSPQELRTLLRPLSRWVDIREDLGMSDLIGWCYRGVSSLHQWCERQELLTGLDLAMAYLDRDLPAEALRVLNGVEPTGGRYWLTMGRALKRSGQEGAARDALKTARDCGADPFTVDLELAGLK